MGRFMTFRLLLAALLACGAGAAQAISARQCAEITVLDGGKWASDFPLPLSLRRNLVFLVKAAMIRSGEYAYETPANLNGVYTDRLADAVAAAQRRLGLPVTGCLTMPLVRAYDPKHR